MIRLAWTAIWWGLRLPLAFIRWLVDAIAWRVRPRPLVVEMALDGHHPARPPASSFFRLRPTPPARRDLRDAVDDLVRDARVHTVAVHIDHVEGGWATLYELRRLLTTLREGGKRVVAHTRFPDLRSLWLASAADEVLAPPDAPVQAAGIGAAVSFFGEGLDRVGVEFDVVAAGAYKSAAESFTRREPSPENREAIEAVLDDLYDRVVDDLAARPGHPQTAEAIRAALDAGPHLANDAVERGLIDATLPVEKLRERLECGPKGRRRAISLGAYDGSPRPWPRLPARRPSLAAVEISGAIVDGRAYGGPVRGAVDRQVCEALARAKKSRLHIDSRGGSATASERIWRAVREVAEKKPVVAWLGDYAASGGYYIASAAQHVVSAPGTLTGSIGVITAKPVAGRLFERLGIHHAFFERGPQALMYTTARRYTEAERSAVERSVASFYELFLRRVAEGRGRDIDSIRPLAEGRVWTGAQALEHGLVDALGDEHEALRVLAEKAGLRGRPRILSVSARRSLIERLAGTGAAAPGWVALLGLWPEIGDPPRALAWCPVILRH